MNNKKYWKEFYQKNTIEEPSSFAEYILPLVKGELIDLGCGNYRDTNFFLFNKIDADGIDEVHGYKVEDHIKKNKSPNNVYARFFWHAIDRPLQLKILKWTKKFIFIEARTTEDAKRLKMAKPHQRNYVNVAQLVSDLKANKFTIISMEEGTGLSPYKKEDPFLVRIIARKEV